MKNNLKNNNYVSLLALIISATFSFSNAYAYENKGKEYFQSPLESTDEVVVTQKHNHRIKSFSSKQFLSSQNKHTVINKQNNRKSRRSPQTSFKIITDNAPVKLTHTRGYKNS